VANMIGLSCGPCSALGCGLLFLWFLFELWVVSLCLFFPLFFVFGGDESSFPVVTQLFSLHMLFFIFLLVLAGDEIFLGRQRNSVPKKNLCNEKARRRVRGRTRAGDRGGFGWLR